MPFYGPVLSCQRSYLCNQLLLCAGKTPELCFGPYLEEALSVTFKLISLPLQRLCKKQMHIAQCRGLRAVVGLRNASTWQAKNSNKGNKRTWSGCHGQWLLGKVCCSEGGVNPERLRVSKPHSVLDRTCWQHHGDVGDLHG